MTNAKQCDRCKKLYLPYKGVQLRKGGNGYTYLSICGYGKENSYDLCEECMTSLIKWIKEAENE